MSVDDALTIVKAEIEHLPQQLSDELQKSLLPVLESDHEILNLSNNNKELLASMMQV